MKILILPTAIFFIAVFSSVNASADTVTPQRPVDYVMSEHAYQSSAIMLPRMEVNFGNQKQVKLAPEFFKRQQEEILSDENIVEAILELIPDDVSDQEAFFDQVRDGIKAEYIKGTDLMMITVTSGDKRFSCDLANQLAERYLKNHKAKEGGKEPEILQKAEIGILIEKKKQEVQQAGAGQPATKSEGNDKPQPEAVPAPR